MKLVGREVLAEFVLKHADAKAWISAWVIEIESTTWRTPHELKTHYGSASFLGQNKVIFNVKGNAYRLEAVVAYKTSVIAVLWAGTHDEYSERY